jgi:hypothetical protein
MRNLEGYANKGLFGGRAEVGFLTKSPNFRVEIHKEDLAGGALKLRLHRRGPPKIPAGSSKVLRLPIGRGHSAVVPQ